MRPWRRRNVVLRNLQGEDAAAMAELHAGAFQRGWGEDEFERLLASATSIGLGAAFSDQGRLGGFVLSRMAGGEAEMLSIVVDASARRHGLGRALLSRHLDQLRQAGVGELFLEVDEENLPARALYRTFGLVAVGRRNAYYTRASGERGTALILRRDLGQ
jgi:ribosomal-protein-alanine N-acetyltransferase